MLRGIDISSHQPAVNWSAVAVVQDFAVIKATGGLSYVNPQYAKQIAGARSVGLLVGHYSVSSRRFP